MFNGHTLVKRRNDHSPFAERTRFLREQYNSFSAVRYRPFGATETIGTDSPRNKLQGDSLFANQIRPALRRCAFTSETMSSESTGIPSPNVTTFAAMVAARSIGAMISAAMIAVPSNLGRGTRRRNQATASVNSNVGSEMIQSDRSGPMNSSFCWAQFDTG